MRHGEAWRVLWLLGAALVWAGACGTSSGSGESESHFLSVCTTSTSCGGDLQCICGVCTLLCADDAACVSVSPQATCQPSAECDGPLSTCDVACASDADCTDVSGAGVCSRGRCRATVAPLVEGGTGDADSIRDASAPFFDSPDSAGWTTDSAASVSSGDRPDSAGLKPDGSGVDASINGTIPFLDWQGGPVALNGGGVSECCFPGVITWYHDEGGSNEVHTLSDCGAYRRVSAVGATCTSAMPPCGASGITPFDIANAMNDSAVRDAVLAAPVTYGRDLRSSGTAADVLSIDGHEIVIGEPCSGAPGCVDAPSAVVSLLDVLQVVGDRMLGTGECRPESGCYQAVDPGECTGAFQRYYYDPDIGQCGPFTYGGCGGNGNKFETRLSCEAACDFNPCLLGVKQSVPDGGACQGTFVFGAYGNAGGCFDDPVVACLCQCQPSGSCTNCW